MLNCITNHSIRCKDSLNGFIRDGRARHPVQHCTLFMIMCCIFLINAYLNCFCRFSQLSGVLCTLVSAHVDIFTEFHFDISCTQAIIFHQKKFISLTMFAQYCQRCTQIYNDVNVDL